MKTGIADVCGRSNHWPCLGVGATMEAPVVKNLGHLYLVGSGNV